MARETRRDVLASIGAVTVAGLAGCASDDGDDGEADDNETDEEMDDGMDEEMDDEEMDEEDDPGTANVRAAHLSPDAPDVDIYVDDERVLSSVSFGAVSDYLEVPAGSRTVKITAAGDEDAVVFEGDVDVAADTAYTVAATGELEGEREFQPQILEDDVSSPGSDTARVRIGHASPDAPAVDVTLASDGSALADGAAFGDTATVEVPAGQYTLQIRPDTPDNDGDVVTEFTVDLAGGAVYSAFAAGYLTPGDDSGDEPFDLVLAIDAGEGGGLVETGSLRAAHLSPDAPDVDVYVDDEQALSGVPFGAVSDYLDVPAGSRTLAITAAGNPDAVVFEGDVQVAADTAYTVAAIGELEGEREFQPLVLEDDRSDPGADTARVRVVHASPDAPAVDVTAAADGSAIVDGAAFGDAATVEVPAGEYTLQVRPDTPDNDGDVVATFDLAFEGGSALTAFAAGYLAPGEASGDEPFDLVVAADGA